MEKKEYEVTAKIYGGFECVVNGKTEEERLVKAQEQIDEADFGSLEDVNWDDPELVDHDGDLYTYTFRVTGEKQKILTMEYSEDIDDEMREYLDSCDFGELRNVEYLIGFSEKT